jgi:uncharacterized protein (DUF302 family)
MAETGWRTGAAASRERAYAMRTTVKLSYEQAVAAVREALQREGFGVLTEIDVRATLKKKLDVDFPPYLILGACNPPLAHGALTAEPDIGLLLPCNLVVYAPPGEDVVVAALDPEQQLRLSGNEAVAPLARDVRARIARVLAGVAGT